MRRALSYVAVLLLLAVSGHAASIADSLAFQGRLLDAADTPIDGSRDMILSLWSDSIGGTQLWTELQVVTVSKGLFSVCLGCTNGSSFFDIFVADDIWLEVQIAGQSPMVPRTRLRNSPRAFTSARVLGDITTSPGRVAIGDLDGDGRLDLAVSPDSAGFSAEKTTSFKSRSGNLVVLDDRSELSLKTFQPGQPQYGNILFSSRDGEVTDYRDCDSDNDGLSDSRLSTVLGGGGGSGGSSLLEADLDGDGAFESSSGSGVSNASVGYSARQGKSGKAKRCDIIADDDGARTIVDCDDDGDGVPETEASLRITPSTSSLAIKTKGTSAQRYSTGGDCDDGDASLHTSCDLDGDGVLESRSSSSSNDSVSQVSVTSRFGSGPRQTTSMDGSFSHASLRCDTDTDGDGSTETSVSHSSSVDSAVISLAMKQLPGLMGPRMSTNLTTSRATHRSSIDQDCDGDDDGIVDVSSSMSITPTTASLAIKTKGTSAQRLSGGTDCDDTDAINYLDFDDDGDGIAESSVSQSSSSDSAHISVQAKKIDGGMPNRISMNVTVDRQTQTGSMGMGQDSNNDGDDDCDGYLRITPTTSSLAINSKGTSAKRVMAQTGPDSASISIDEPGVHVAMTSKGWDGTIKGRVCVTDGTDLKVDFDGDGDGYVSNRFGIGVLDPSNPLEHSSGAHLTAGGTWTNASDENLKENFKSVDGAELLEKIEELPISQWNYKNESDDVTHIGPTAQDFKAAFGVGSDGKSISTIDPSGIALAAIKELKKENDELKKQLKQQKDEFASRIEELSRLVKQMSKDK